MREAEFSMHYFFDLQAARANARAILGDDINSDEDVWETTHLDTGVLHYCPQRERWMLGFYTILTCLAGYSRKDKSSS